MIVRRGPLALAGLALLTSLAGCETTADKSARLAEDARAKVGTQERGLQVGAGNPDVRVLSKAAITDANGTAVVVTLRDTGRSAMADVPIAIDVHDAAGKSIFRNDQPGADAGLVSAALLSPGERLDWVHDQVEVAGQKSARVTVRVGKPRRRAPARLPRLVLGRMMLTDDGSGGLEGRGRITNRSAGEQRDVTIYAVARSQARVVAAGRAVVPSVAARRSASFAIYFIGDPAHARITLSATPSVGA